MNSKPGARRDRVVDLDSLKALAHPLRVQIFDALSMYGPATASGLAERLGESSGATSYHLRQLEKHAFVQEVVGKGTERERWWERAPGGVTVEPGDFADSPSGREASRMVIREWGAARERLLRAFEERGYDELPAEWVAASMVSSSNYRLTVDQLADFRDRYMAMIDEFHEKFRGQSVPGSRPVQIQFNAFPIMDGEVTPGSDEKQ
ncbi:MAG TPA: helix-turn-helix domain-containing protein [Homoserinimonas sp.]|nr:helix-turn-helix domain-containing protein [Homoserinimonas sp.]